jgi:UDP-N-acetylglucosamine--N-acetylmuramyl-(pentapeptide) pyrophosphoryl-undecaprenol N-acetylglucosamine transferase
MSISELCVIGKPVIFIPSPYVSEDHQTKNALALTHKDAAILLKETEALDQIEQLLEDLLNDEGKRKELAENIKALARPTADDEIAHHVLEFIGS